MFSMLEQVAAGPRFVGHIGRRSGFYNVIQADHVVGSGVKA